MSSGDEALEALDLFAISMNGDRGRAHQALVHRRLDLDPVGKFAVRTKSPAALAASAS